MAYTGVAVSTPTFETLATTGTSVLGSAAASLVGFHGGAGTAQSAFVATLSGAALSVSGIVGFTSSTSVSQLVGLVNAMQAVLVNHGLMAAS